MFLYLYDLEAWETAKYARKLRGERSSTKERTVFDDERELERERRAEAEKRDRAAEQAELRDRARDGDRMKDAREAELLRAEQQHASAGRPGRGPPHPAEAGRARAREGGRRAEASLGINK